MQRSSWFGLSARYIIACELLIYVWLFGHKPKEQFLGKFRIIRSLSLCVCAFFILISVHSTLFYIYTRFKAHFFVFYLDPSLVCLYCVRQIENCNVIELRKRISSYGCNVILEVGLWSHTLFIQSPIFYIHFFSHFSLFIHHGPSLFFFFMFGFILYVVGECETIATTFGIWFMYVCVCVYFWWVEKPLLGSESLFS